MSVEAVLRHHQPRQAARVSNGAARIPSRCKPLPGLASIAPCEETGVTFEENAVQKALYYSKFCDGYLFVDDSGLEVDALDGAPGVYSARFAGPNATDAANNQLLLDRMRGVADRTARFVCVVALAESGRLVRTFRGEVEGQLARSASGSQWLRIRSAVLLPALRLQLWRSSAGSQDGSKPSRPSATSDARVPGRDCGLT